MNIAVACRTPRARRACRAVLALTVALGVGGGAAACGGSGGSGAPSQAGSPPAQDVSAAGDIPDTQTYVAFSPASGVYRIKVPEGWARTDLASGASFSAKLNSIRVEARPAPVPPSEAAVRATELPVLRSGATNFRLVHIGTSAGAAGPAVVVTYRADGPRDPVTGKRFAQDVEVHELWKSGTLVTLTLASPHGADNVDPWRMITDSFAWSA